MHSSFDTPRRWFSWRALAVCLFASAFSFWAGRLGNRVPTVYAGSPCSVADSVSPMSEEIRATSWQQITEQPSTPVREKIMAAYIEQLAGANPGQALGVAKAEPNRILRDTLLQAALRGWAAADAKAAIQWLLSQPDLNRTPAMAALLSGAVRVPTEAVDLVLELGQSSPLLVRESGAQLIAALSESGEFARAAGFAARAAPELRSEWLTAAFGRWATFQPEGAAAAALELTDPLGRQTALQAVISGWAQVQPAELAEFAKTLPAGPERANALRAALCTWGHDNPGEVAIWLESQSAHSEFDAGATVVATSSLFAGQPDAAIVWARRIVDGDLRSSTLATILRDLGNRDPAAVRTYAENMPDLYTSDRASVLSGLVLIASP